LTKVQEIHGVNAKGIFVFLWLKRLKFKMNLFEQTFKIKALSVDEHSKKKKLAGEWRHVRFFRCYRKDLKDIWDYLPALRPL
jgi:hypothetical protein